MADIDLDGIQQRAGTLAGLRMQDDVAPGSVSSYLLLDAALKSASDVPALAREVQRVRALGVSSERRFTRQARELEEERRNCANLREERDRLRNELGQALQHPPVVLCALCKPPAVIAASGLADHNAWNHAGQESRGQTVTRSGRRLKFDEAGGA